MNIQIVITNQLQNTVSNPVSIQQSKQIPDSERIQEIQEESNSERIDSEQLTDQILENPLLTPNQEESRSNSKELLFLLYLPNSNRISNSEIEKISIEKSTEIENFFVSEYNNNLIQIEYYISK